MRANRAKIRISLAIKVFLMTTTCVLFTLVVTSSYSTTQLLNYLSRDMLTRFGSDTKDSANAVSGILDYWASLAAIGTHNAMSFDERNRQDFLQNFAASNKEIVSIGIAETKSNETKWTNAFNSIETSIERGEFDTEDVNEFITSFNQQWLNTLSTKGSRKGAFFVDLNPETKLPLFALAMQFQNSQSDSHIWVFMTFWQTRLLNVWPKENSVKSYLTDMSGHTILTKDNVDAKNRPLGIGQEFITIASTSKSDLTLKESTDSSGESVVMSGTKLKRWDLLFISVAETNGTRREITQLIFRSATLTWIFLMVFVLFSYLGANRVTRRLLAVIKATESIAKGDFKVNIPASSPDEVGDLSRAVQHMSGQIQDLLDGAVDAARKAKELETARMVQEAFLPRKTISSSKVNVEGACRAASECGGDWWFHYQDNSGNVFVIIADATGHGAGAALVTAMAFGACKAIFSGTSVENHNIRPSDILRTFNSVLWEAGCGMARTKTTMTACALCIDVHTNSLTYSSAGHLPSALFPENPDSDDRLESHRRRRSFLSIHATGDLLGMNEVITVTDVVFELRRGDRLVLYTDGVTETANKDGDFFGKRRLFDFVSTHRGRAMHQLKEELLSEIDSYRGDASMSDDVTVVFVDLAGDPSMILLPTDAAS